MPKYTVEDAPQTAPPKYTVEDSTPAPTPALGGRTPTGEPADGDTRNSFQRWADNLSTPDPRREEWQTPTQRNAAHAAQSFASVPLSMVAHPWESAKGMAKMVADFGTGNPYTFGADVAAPIAENVIKDNAAHGPLYAASGLGGNIAGQVATAEAAPVAFKAAKVATAPIRLIPKVLRGGADILAGTTPKVAAELGETTMADNAAAQAKADAANAGLDTKRSQQLQQHFDKTQAVRQANEAAQAVQSRKAALNRGVEQLDPKFQEDLKATEKNVRAQANDKYTAVRAATEGETVPSESLAAAVKEAEGKIQGSSENLKVFRDILSKHPEGEPESIAYQGAQIPKGHPLYDVLKEGGEAGAAPATFSDLQGYYTELGSKLSQGNLPGDVFQAMKSLQGSIGDLMQKMADSKGAGDQLKDARAFYRDYMGAFRDSSSPLNKAMNATERGKAVAALKGADQSGIETLARYDPELARRANTIRGYQAEAKSIPAKAPVVKAEPTLPPAAPPVLADIKKIGLGDIQEAKAASMAKKKGPAGGPFGHAAGGIGTWHFVTSAMHGSVEGMALGGAFATAPYILAKVLKNPAVARILSAPTPADIAAMPAEIRANLPQIVSAAQKEGIKVHPALVLMARPNETQQ